MLGLVGPRRFAEKESEREGECEGVGGEGEDGGKGRNDDGNFGRGMHAWAGHRL